jgi:hypothetical protein
LPPPYPKLSAEADTGNETTASLADDAILQSEKSKSEAIALEKLLTLEDLGKGLLPQAYVTYFVKFPSLIPSLPNIGIKKTADIGKLNSVALSLPVISNLKDLPAEVVTTKGADGKIGLSSSISLKSSGKIEQKIQTLANTKLMLAVKPVGRADGVTGYLVLREARQSASKTKPNSNLAAAEASLIMPNDSAKTEQNLNTATFSYTDPDGDGIYTANITTPAVEGTYEVITIIAYHDKKLGTKELRLTTVVDPEGYVFETVGGQELRISGAKISIAYAGSGNLWDAQNYNQKNPVITGKSGRYSFLVPEGKYFIVAEAAGYRSYRSEIVEVNAENGIHLNIEMKKRLAIDWKLAIIVVLIVTIGLNMLKKLLGRRLAKSRR